MEKRVCSYCGLSRDNGEDIELRFDNGSTTDIFRCADCKREMEQPFDMEKEVRGVKDMMNGFIGLFMGDK